MVIITNFSTRIYGAVSYSQDICFMHNVRLIDLFLVPEMRLIFNMAIATTLHN